MPPQTLLESQEGWKSRFRTCFKGENRKNFPGGGMPPDPLEDTAIHADDVLDPPPCTHTTGSRKWSAM